VRFPIIAGWTWEEFQWTSAVYLPEIRLLTFRGVRAVDRAEAWVTFVLFLVGGIVLLSFMGVLVGAWVDHAVSSLIHTLGTPLVLFR
jgi:hypothetical protein